MSISLRGKYAIAPNTYFKCLFEFETLSGPELTMQCGIQTMGDTKVPVASRIKLDPEEAKKHFTANSDKLSRYTTRVEAQSTKDGKIYHTCAAIQTKGFPERRQQQRLTNFFTVKLENTMNIEFLATEGNLQGLTLFCTTQHRFSGCGVGQEKEIILTYKNESVPIQGQIRHVHYDLKEGKLMLGIALAPMKKRQADILMSLLDPDFVPETEKILTTQISADKISAQ